MFALFKRQIQLTSRGEIDEEQFELASAGIWAFRFTEFIDNSLTPFGWSSYIFFVNGVLVRTRLSKIRSSKAS